VFRDAATSGCTRPSAAERWLVSPVTNFRAAATMYRGAVEPGTGSVVVTMEIPAQRQRAVPNRAAIRSVPSLHQAQYALLGAAGCRLAAAIPLSVRFLNLAFLRGALFCPFTTFCTTWLLSGKKTEEDTPGPRCVAMPSQSGQIQSRRGSRNVWIVQ
jgi:hypothetical protein